MKMLSNSKNINLRKATRHDVDFIVSLENDTDNNLYIGKWNYDTHILALENKDI